MKKVILLSTALAFYLHAHEIKSLNDITVTAQKTEENVQDIPIALSVFNDIALEDKKITNLKEISYFVPNFYLLDSGDWGVFSTSMRGIAANAQTLSSSVGLYIDGVPHTNSVGFSAVLEDIERIEVLRGPQGTLYGKNAEAGVINVVTKKPTNTTEGEISVEYGEDNKQQISAIVRTPIVKDKFFIGITGKYYAKNGNMENTYLDKRLNDRKNYFGKIYLRATPTDRLEMSFIASKFKRDDGAASSNTITANDYRKLQSDIEGYIDNSSDLYSFILNYDFDMFKLNSTTSYANYNQNAFMDYDYSIKKIMHGKADNTYKTLSEELKLNGKYQNLKWLLGFFGSKYKKTGGFRYFSDIPNATYKDYNTADAINFGIFTHLNYEITDKLNLIGGLRYDNDKSTIDNNKKDKDVKSNDISPKVAIEYKWNANLMSYASIAKGYKSAGFYLYADPNYPLGYKSENLWNYELGFKSALLDNSLVLNANIYYMDISDKQVLTMVTPMTGYVSNAAHATSYGFEIDANYILNNNINIFGAFGYNQSQFKDYKDITNDYKNNYVAFAPKYNYSLGMQYRDFGGFYASANIVGYGKMYLDDANIHKQGAYALVNTKIGYEWDNFDLYLYADNLFNKNYDMVGYFGNYVNINPDREIGIKFTYRF